MATIIDLGKLRFEYRGEYNSGTTYEANDVVKYGGNLYVYKYGLKASGNTPQTGSLYWDLMIEGFKFEGIYDSSATYNIGDGFSYGGRVYITTANSVSGTRPSGSLTDSYYTLFTDGLQFDSTYDATIEYQKNDLVKYGGKTYIAKSDPSSAGISPTNTLHWSVLADGTRTTGDYDSTSTYFPGDIVKHGPNHYITSSDISAGDSPNVGAWTTYIEGQRFRDSYNAGVLYFKNDIVTHGGHIYQAVRDNIKGFQPDTSSTALWKALAKGNNFRGEFNTSLQYAVGDTVTYGSGHFVAKQSTTGTNYPGVATAYWHKLSDGFDPKGEWDRGVLYKINDLVTRGASSYRATTQHTSGNNFGPDSANWTAFARGSRFRGTYDSSGVYVKDDVISYSTSSYIAIADSINAGNFPTELSAGSWQLYAAGGSSVLPSLSGAADAGKFLSSQDGTTYAWAIPGATAQVFYVATDGQDNVNFGHSIDKAWLTVKYALTQIAATNAPATLFVKEGSYREDLPMTVPANCNIVGDGQRNTIIYPNAGDSQETMFYMNSGTTMEGLMFKGLTGFAKDSAGGQPDNIEYATIGGVYLRLDPTGVIVKSPYVKESTAFSSGGVGAIIDGGLNANAANQGSMVFHTFTQVHDGGAGFWVRRKGKSEIVSCFTYYNDFGLAASSGGKIRALNCNNSYGTYGAMSEGFDSTEAVISGVIRGTQLNYDGNTLTGTDFQAGKELFGVAESGTTSYLTKDTVGSFRSYAHTLQTGQRIQLNSILNTGESDGALGRGSGHSTANRGARAGYSTNWGNLYDSNYMYIVEAVNDSNFKLYTDSARTNGVNTSLAGMGYDSSTGVTDILRQNPMRITTNSTVFAADSYTQVAITGVAGTTQVNNNWYTIDQTTGNYLYMRNSEHNTIRVRRGIEGTTFSGTMGGTTYDFTGAKNPAITLWKGSRYHFIADSANAITGGRMVIGNFRGDAATGAGAAFTNGAGPATFKDGVQTANNLLTPSSTRIYNNRNTLKTALDSASDTAVDSVNQGLIFYLGNYSQANDSAWIMFDSTDSAGLSLVDINIGTPSTVDASSFSAYSSGGTLTFKDSGENWASANWTSPRTTGFIVNSQITQDKLYVENISFPGFRAGEKISDSGGVVTADLLNSGHQTGQKGFIIALTNLSYQPQEGASLTFTGDSNNKSYVVQTVSGWESAEGNVLLTLSQEKLKPQDSGTAAQLRYDYSQVRMTGHDFLSIGTGGVTTTNYPGLPTVAENQGNEVIEKSPGRVYYVSTDQDGNFRVGNYFRIDQATGRATLDASAFDLSGLTSLKLGSIGAQIGEQINEFSSDGTMSGNSNTAVPTEAAVKTYVDYLGTSAASNMLSGAYDSALSTYQTIDNVADSTGIRDSGGARYLSYTIGDMKYTNINYDSAGLITSYTEELKLGYGAAVTQNVAVTYDSSGSVKTIVTS